MAALGWFDEIPFVSKVYLTTSLAITTACFLDFVSPLTLYYNFDLIFQKGQYWRLITSYFFFGTFSLDFLFHVYFVVNIFPSSPSLCLFLFLYPYLPL
jgi:Derlin-2/3